MTGILTVTMNPSLDLFASSEEIRPVSKNRCTDPEHWPGGGGINVARVLARLGAEVSALHTSGGPIGALLERCLAREGLNTLPVAIGADTRQNVTILERSTAREFRFVLPGPAVAEAEWRACLDRIAGIDPAPGWIVASGSLPPGVSPAFHAELADHARRIGAAFVLDSSGPALAAGLEAGVYLVKPNLRELRELSGRVLDTEEAVGDAASALVTGGRAAIVAVSLGADGALLATADGLCRASGIPVEVKSAVGAGDSFVGAMVHALSRGDPVREAFRRGVAAGTAALVTSGADLCRVEDAERLLAEVRLKDL